MSDVTAEQLGKRAHECGLLTLNEVQGALRAAGGSEVATYDDFIGVLMQRELLTNWQIDKLAKGEVQGFFFGKWKVLYFIGAGTFARVYRAVHVDTKDVKAVKVLRSRHTNEETSREQFIREGNMVKELRHPNITPIYEVDQNKGRIYMVMDFVEGQNLRDYFRAHRKISALRSLAIARDVAAGLAYAADRNITHRDLKLSNVLLSAKGQAKLVDFGLAAVSGDGADKSGKIPRTLMYSVLEKASKCKRDDKRSDLYFLGAMLYEMISGKGPLFETREQLKRLAPDNFHNVKPITDHDPDLPDRLVILINRLMEVDPNRRIQTPALAQQEIEACIASIKSGDVKKFDAAASAEAAAEYEKQLLLKEEGRGHTIMLIESNTQLQDVLRDKLKGLGYRVLITTDPVRGLERFQDMHAGEDEIRGCVIFGCVGLGREGMQACYNFAATEETSSIPSLMIVTEKLKRHVNQELLSDKHQVLVMPVKFGHVQLMLRKLLGIELPS
jgi:tRNA A-37 threonylcarbamoyl transferase component Bud32